MNEQSIAFLKRTLARCGDEIQSQTEIKTAAQQRVDLATAEIAKQESYIADLKMAITRLGGTL